MEPLCEARKVDEEEEWMEQGAHAVCYSCSLSPHPIWCCHGHDCEEES